MLLKIINALGLFFGLNISLSLFGEPSTPILTVTNHELQLNVINSIVTAVTSIILTIVAPLVLMYFKKKWKIKSDD